MFLLITVGRKEKSSSPASPNLFPNRSRFPQQQTVALLVGEEEIRVAYLPDGQSRKKWQNLTPHHAQQWQQAGVQALRKHSVDQKSGRIAPE